MKYVATTLMGLLLLGVCSARTLDTRNPREMDDNMKPREADSWKAAQDYRREGEQKGEEQNTQPWAQLRETVYQKLRNMYQQLTSSDHSFPVETLPELADPIYVDTIDGQYTMLNYHYENVQFKGLRSADQAVIKVNTVSEEATLTLSLKSAEIYGNYEVHDPSKKVAGKFDIKMYGDLSYVCTYHYQLEDGIKVQLQHSSGKLMYNRPVSHYENAAFPDFIQTPLQTALLKMIDEKVHAELHSKFGHRVLQAIQATKTGHQQDPIEKVMGEGIKNAINGVQQVLSKRGVFSIDLTNEDTEIMHNKLHAKITSVKLNGLEKLFLANNQVSTENTDKIRAKLQLAINRPTATATVNIHESHDDNAPFQNVNVDFDMEKLMAELSFEKATRQSGLELRSVETKVERIRPMGTEKLQGDVSNLVKEKLTDHMKRYVEQGLKNFIQNEYLYIQSQGVLPPGLEKHSSRN